MPRHGVALSGGLRPLERDDVSRHEHVRSRGSFDHPIRAHQDGLRDGDAERLGRFRVTLSYDHFRVN